MLLLPLAGRFLVIDCDIFSWQKNVNSLQWSEAHEDVSCEQFAKWLELNNGDTQELQLAVFLEENGVRCPNCKSRYALSRGGCMHFKCAQCSFQVSVQYSYYLSPFPIRVVHDVYDATPRLRDHGKDTA